jgi:hypothetical protein
MCVFGKLLFRIEAQMLRTANALIDAMALIEPSAPERKRLLVDMIAMLP